MATQVGNPPRREELVVYAVIGRTLGVEVEHHDTGLEDGMVDGHFTLPDGRTGAVEVTTVAAPKAMETESLVPRWQLTIPGLRWAWHINIGPGLPLHHIEHHLQQLIPRCEQQGWSHIDDMNPLPDLLDSYTWYFNHDIQVFGTPDTSHPGRIYLVPGTGSGGAVPDGLDGFPAWLADTIVADPTLVARIAKLNRSGRQERHLILRIHQTWLPFEYEYHVGWEPTVPTEPFDAPAGVTGIWLGTRWKRPMLYWTADNGWGRADYE